MSLVLLETRKAVLLDEAPIVKISFFFSFAVMNGSSILIMLKLDISCFENKTYSDRMTSQKPYDQGLHFLPCSMKVHADNWSPANWIQMRSRHQMSRKAK